MAKKIKLIKRYFEKEPSVVLAFLFGSFAKGLEMEESDFDVAVYLKEKERRDKIWLEVTRIVEKEVDLVCLNDAPATLISNVFKTGIPLVIKDKKLYWELYLNKSSEAEDFLGFLEDFWKIKKRAKSLDKEGKARLLIRVDYLKTELKDLNRFKSLSWEEYRDDRDKRKLIERWAENIINATIDIAKIILASEKKKMPKSYGDALYDFGAMIGLAERESEKFSKLADLRNILVHEYLDILCKKIQDFIKEAPEIYKKIFNFLEKYLK